MQLRPLTLDDKSIFETYASQMQTYLSNYAFAPLFVWQNHFQFYWTLLHNHFCIFAKQGDDYFMPILPIPDAVDKHLFLKTVREAYQFMVESNRQSADRTHRECTSRNVTNVQWDRFSCETERD